MEGDGHPQWPWKVAALVNGRIRGKEILLSLCRRTHRDKARCLHSFSARIALQPRVCCVISRAQSERTLGDELLIPSHSGWNILYLSCFYPRQQHDSGYWVGWAVDATIHQSRIDKSLCRPSVDTENEYSLFSICYCDNIVVFCIHDQQMMNCNDFDHLTFASKAGHCLQ